MNNILLISKEVLRPDYLSCYGGTLCQTSNIDALASQGTVFTNFYTASPSSAMAFTSMFTGLYPFETERKSYREVARFSQCPTLSDKLEEQGFEVHVIWAGKWFKGSHKRSRVFSPSTHFHNLENIYTLVGPHFLRKSQKLATFHIDPLKTIYDEVKAILDRRKKNVFIWLHCPHVFIGRPGYGSDIDLFDKLVGMLLDFFTPGEVYLTGDHGHMNCEKGIPVYGFHVYEGAIKIPLITPNHFKSHVIDDLVSNIQLKNIILNHSYEKREFIYADTQYYLQENRKLMIRKGDYKYIYNKKNKSEELYDLKLDPHENVNLLIDKWVDRNRNKFYSLEEIFYYPRWEEARRAYAELRKEKDRIWKQGKYWEEMMFRFNTVRKEGLGALAKYFIFRKTKFRGRWNSWAQAGRYEA